MKWLKLSGGLVLLAAVVGLILLLTRQPPVPVEVHVVAAGPLEVTVDEDGMSRIKDKYIVSTPVGGRLQRIEWRPGDPVVCEQTVLASIQPASPDLLDARSLAQAQARVAAAQAAVERAQARANHALAELEYAQSDYARAQNLIARQAISEKEFDQIRTRVRTSQESHRSAEFERDIARYELELARAAVLHVQSDLDDVGEWPDPPHDGYFVIRAPIDGVVLRVLQESSTIVTPGTPIIEVGDPRDLEFIVDVLTTDAVKIQPGARVYLERWGGDESILGRVRLIEPSAFQKISALGVEEQRVNVIIDLERNSLDRESEEDDNTQPIQSLGDGYRIEARIVVWQADDVIQVPTSALFRQQNQWSVFVVRDQFAYLTPVEVGHRSDQFAEIRDGLSVGDLVVLHPSDQLADGIRVDFE